MDAWVLRHILLSIDDRPRVSRDRAGLDASVRHTLDWLRARPAPPPFVPPAGLLASPALCFGVPLWAFETNSWVFAPNGPGADCIVVDVPPDVGPLLDEIARHDLRVGAVFLTHAHLDHTGGVPELLAACAVPPPVFVHTADLEQVTTPLGVDAVLRRAAGL